MLYITYIITITVNVHFITIYYQPSLITIDMNIYSFSMLKHKIADFDVDVLNLNENSQPMLNYSLLEFIQEFKKSTTILQSNKSISVLSALVLLPNDLKFPCCLIIYLISNLAEYRGVFFSLFAGV